MGLMQEGAWGNDTEAAAMGNNENMCTSVFQYISVFASVTLSGDKFLRQITYCALTNFHIPQKWPLLPPSAPP